MAGSRCGTKGTLLLPRKRHPVRYFSATATGVSQVLTVLPSGANGLGEHWTAALESLDSRATDENVQRYDH